MDHKSDDEQLRAWLRMTCDPHAKLNDAYHCSPWTLPQISAMVERMAAELADVKKRFEEKLLEPVAVLRLEDYDAGYAACERDVVAMLERDAALCDGAAARKTGDRLREIARYVDRGDHKGKV